MFADVIVDIQHEKLDKIFQYRIPEELESRLQPGMEVVVPFGKGNRQIKGYVTGFSEKCEYDLSKVKSILSISEKGMEIETRLIALAAWMKEHYGGTMIQSLKTVLPIRQKENAKVKKHLRLLLSEKEGEEKLAFYRKKNQKARARLLEALLADRLLDYELVTGKLNITLPVIRALEEQGVLKLESEQIYRNPVQQGTQQDWTLCGSLCTTNDVLVRSISLTGLQPGDLLVFENAGAYSVTEGLGLFLSRDLPQIVLWQNGAPQLVRGFTPTHPLNTPLGGL